MAVGRAYHW